MSCLEVSTYDVLNNTNNTKEFPELRKVFEESFEIKVQERSVLKYLNYYISRYPLGFGIYQTGRIMDLLNEWFPNL